MTDDERKMDAWRNYLTRDGMRIMLLVDADIDAGKLPTWVRELVWEKLCAEYDQEAEQRARQLVYTFYG